jgi:mannose-6-phosphate isomerase
MLYPLTFHPLFKDRTWGGRRLETLYRKRRPSNGGIGESWEVSDRPGDESVVANGALAGRSLHWITREHGAELLGRTRPALDGRFPLLCKILDAQQPLSLQVHPPARVAAALQGEPKTEMWYIAEAAPGAELFVGLRRGVTRAEFEAKIATGEVADCFHRIPVTAGDTMFLPSGRVHAIGAGLVIFEIQQNSDTTYRVFDWNRQPPRELHVPQSLASIDFSDFEPTLVSPNLVDPGPPPRRALVRHPLFDVDLIATDAPATQTFDRGRLRVAAIVAGRATVSGAGVSVDLAAGQFCVIPAALTDAAIALEGESKVLVTQAGA